MILLFVLFHGDVFNVLAVRVVLDVGDNLPAFVVVAVAKFVTGQHGLDAQVLQQPLIVVRTAAAHKEGCGFAVEAGLVGRHLILHLGQFFSDNLFGALCKLGVAKVGSHVAQALNRTFQTDKVDLEPVHAVLGLHHFGDVVDGAVALHEVQVCLVRAGDAFHFSVAGEHRNHFVADLFKDAFLLPAVAADVVFAKDVDRILGGGFVAACTDDALHEAVVGDVVARRLAYALITFAAVRHAADAVFLFSFCGHGLDVVADQAHRAGGGDHDGLGVHKLHDFINGLLELLGAAKDDIGLLHVCGEAVLNVVGGIPFCLGLVAARAPAVEAAANRAVGNRNHVLDGTEHNALAASVTAAPVGHDAGNGTRVGYNHLVFSRVNLEHVLFAVLEDLGVVAL